MLGLKYFFGNVFKKETSLKVSQGNEYQSFLLKKKFFIPMFF